MPSCVNYINRLIILTQDPYQLIWRQLLNSMSNRDILQLSDDEVLIAQNLAVKLSIPYQTLWVGNNLSQIFQSMVGGEVLVLRYEDLITDETAERRAQVSSVLS